MTKSRIKTLLTAAISLFKWEKKVPVLQVVPDKQLLSGKVALIVGATGGIGSCIAKTFKDSGCKVIASARNEEKLKTKAKELNEDVSIVIDLKRVGEFEHQIEVAAQLLGGIDIVVFCAGIHTRRFGFDFLNVKEDEYDEVMDTNLKGVYFLSQAVAKYMIKNGIRGHLLYISSQSALEASWSPYRLSKRGLNGLTEGLAQKLLPYGIVVNAIAPGPSATDMQDEQIDGSIYTPDNPIHRYTMPEEIAEYAKLMVSGLGDTIIGSTLYMSGGRGIIDGK